MKQLSFSSDWMLSSRPVGARTKRPPREDRERHRCGPAGSERVAVGDRSGSWLSGRRCQRSGRSCERSGGRLHIPEDAGGQGFAVAELAVVPEELGHEVPRVRSFHRMGSRSSISPAGSCRSRVTALSRWRGGRAAAVRLGRTLAAAEAAGGARACTEMAVAYALQTRAVRPCHRVIPGCEAPLQETRGRFGRCRFGKRRLLSRSVRHELRDEGLGGRCGGTRSEDRTQLHLDSRSHPEGP